MLSHQIPSFYISFTFFFYICSSHFFHPVVAASVFLSFSFSFFLLFFTSIVAAFFLSSLFHLFTLMLLWVLLYFFMGLFVFESVGFVWAYAEEGETMAKFLFMGCVFVRWLGCVSWVFKGWDRWVWVISSGRRQSGSGLGSDSDQV